MEKWEQPSYQKIEDVKYDQNKLLIWFENGDEIEVPIEAVVQYGTTDIEWSKINNTSYALTVPAKPNDIEIPWDKLRVISDKDFSKHLAEKAEEQAKLIGIKIKRLREKKGLKANDLAERAGITAQTISRIEKGHTDVNFGTLRKILASMGYSLRDLANQELELEMDSSQKNYTHLLRKLALTGIDTNLLTKKIIPANIQAALTEYKGQQPELLLDEAASYVSNIYGWPLNDIWSNQLLTIKNEPAAAAYFKMPANANLNQIKAYAHYAFYLAKIVLKSSSNIISKEYPGDINEFRNGLLKLYEKIDLSNVLSYAWDLGICVLPLNDSGVFHGASWNIEGRHVVVLKQNTNSHARWIFDLLHELYHVFAHLDKPNSSVVETEELSPFSSNESVEELEANSFANKVLFGNNAEKLAEECVKDAGWKLENLKNSVVKIAEKEKISPDILSNYLAFRLSYQGQNWWSTATKLQITEPDPFKLAVDFINKKIDRDKLNPIDSNLLSTALNF